MNTTHTTRRIASDIRAIETKREDLYAELATATGRRFWDLQDQIDQLNHTWATKMQAA